jgi:hypothetical protein
LWLVGVADAPVRYQAGRHVLHRRDHLLGEAVEALDDRVVALRQCGRPLYRRTVSDRATIDAEVATFNPCAAAGRPPGG